MPDVFISHKTEDDDLARQIARVFREERISFYLDDYDQNASKSDDITAYLAEKISECFALMAVVTLNTKSSWWVPFEIGVATECPRAISSMTSLTSVSLPEYLKKWPILRDESDLRAFAKVFREHSLSGKHVVESRSKLEGTVRSFESEVRAEQQSYRWVR